jgi:hypothetical protein
MRTYKFVVPAVLLAFVASQAVAKDAQPPTKAAPAEKKAEEPKKEDAKAAKDVKDVPEAIGKAKAIWAAFKGGKYREAVAGIIVILMFLWRRFASKLIIGKLSPWWVGFVTVLLGYVGSIPEALAADAFKWSAFIWSGLITSAEAMLFWQLIAKKAFPKLLGAIEKKEE